MSLIRWTRVFPPILSSGRVCRRWELFLVYLIKVTSKAIWVWDFLWKNIFWLLNSFHVYRTIPIAYFTLTHFEHFFPYFQMYWHKLIIMPSICLLSAAPIVMSLLHSLYVLFRSPHFFMIELARDLSILLIFSLQNSWLFAWLILSLYLFLNH